MEKIDDKVKSQARCLSGIAHSSINNQMSFAEHALHLVTLVEENEDLDDSLKVMFVECMALLCKAIKNSISGTCIVEVKYEGEITSNQETSDAVNTLEGGRRKKAIYNSIMKVLMSDAGKMLQSATNSELDELALKKATTDYAQIDDEITQLKRELSQCREIRKGFKPSKGAITPRGRNTPRGAATAQESAFRGWVVVDDDIMPLLRSKSLKISRHIAQLNTRNKSLDKGIESTKKEIDRYIAKFNELAESPSNSKLFRLTKKKIMLSLSPNSTTLITSALCASDMAQTEIEEFAAELNKTNYCEEVKDPEVTVEDCVYHHEPSADNNETKDILEEETEVQKEDSMDVSDEYVPEPVQVESDESDGADASTVNKTCVLDEVAETAAVQEIEEEQQTEHSTPEEENSVPETEEPIPEVTTATVDDESHEVEPEPIAEESQKEPLEDVEVPDIELPLRTETSDVESSDSSVDDEELQESCVPSDDVESESVENVIDEETKRDVPEDAIIVEQGCYTSRAEELEIIADDNIEKDEAELKNTTICCTGEAPTIPNVKVAETSEYGLSDDSLYVEDSSKRTEDSSLSSDGSVYGESSREAVDSGQDPATLTGLFRRLDAFDFFNVPADFEHFGNVVEDAHAHLSTRPSTQVTDTGSPTCYSVTKINPLEAKECITPVIPERNILEKATSTDAPLEEPRIQQEEVGQYQQEEVAEKQVSKQSEYLNNETRLFDAEDANRTGNRGLETSVRGRSKSTSAVSVDHNLSRCNSGEFACNIVYKLRPSRPDEFTNEVRIYYTPQDELPTIFLPLLSSSSVVKQPALMATQGIASERSNRSRNTSDNFLGNDKYGRTYRTRNGDNKEGSVWGLFNNCWSWITNGY